jgi:hypothetical protein
VEQDLLEALALMDQQVPRALKVLSVDRVPQALKALREHKVHKAEQALLEHKDLKARKDPVPFPL